MDLLPKTSQEFNHKAYWNRFFRIRGNRAFEWYGEYAELCGILLSYLRNTDTILIPGCGNSALCFDLYDTGYKRIDCIDISSVVIRQMAARVDKDRPLLRFHEMDALKMSFPDKKFNAIIDKGTLDALLADDNPDTITSAREYLSEINRVLNNGGRYICISLLQEHILKELLAFFPSRNYLFRVRRCLDAEKKAQSQGESFMPVFMVVCMKMTIPLPHPLYELEVRPTETVRLGTADRMLSGVKEVQQSAHVKSYVKNLLAFKQEAYVELCKPPSETPRYTVHVLDVEPQTGYVEYSAFIVPEGREAEWLFSTPAGRVHLAEVTKSRRLAIISLHRDQEYPDMTKIQEEISAAVCDMAPEGLAHHRIPFMSLGDQDEGKRKVLLKGRSEYAGDFVVEDVTVSNQCFRRLYYLSNQLVIQSEAKVKSGGKKKPRLAGGPKAEIDLTYLTCKHHIYMSIPTHLACLNQKSPSVAVIGLGGGGLCSFLHRFIPEATITGVDIDCEMLKVAVNWFGLVQDDKFKVVIKDGVAFLKDQLDAGVQYNAVLLDVDNKDNSLGMSCPPEEFLAKSFLEAVAKLVAVNGFLIVNVVLRNLDLKQKVYTSLKAHFHTLVTYKLADELNEIYVCAQKERDFKQLQVDLAKSATEINKFFNQNKNGHMLTVEPNTYITRLKNYLTHFNELRYYRDS